MFVKFYNTICNVNPLFTALLCNLLVLVPPFRNLNSKEMQKYLFKLINAKNDAPYTSDLHFFKLYIMYSNLIKIKFLINKFRIQYLSLY